MILSTKRKKNENYLTDGKWCNVVFYKEGEGNNDVSSKTQGGRFSSGSLSFYTNLCPLRSPFLVKTSLSELLFGKGM